VNIVSHPPLKKLVESFRDWGRDCWCASGKDNTCGKRFDWKLGELPEGYDHKYIYSHLGYNLKPLDLQAAIGRVQLRKLPSFIQSRKDNWEILRRGLDGFGDMFDFSLPTHATNWTSGEGFSWDGKGSMSDCSWFGFMIRVRPIARFKVRDLAKYLDQKKIGNRMLFGGNLTRQPAFVQLKRDNPQSFRSIGEMNGADEIMSRSIFIGVYPGLSDPQLEHTVLMIKKFCEGHKL
jgi:CDP-6-deoxy-D-xylo-4-hexulose-3-dehydrase